MPCNCAGFSTDGSLLAVGTGDLVTLWDPWENALLGTLEPPFENDGCPITRIAFIPGTPYLAACSEVPPFLPLPSLQSPVLPSVSPSRLHLLPRPRSPQCPLVFLSMCCCNRYSTLAVDTLLLQSMLYSCNCCFALAVDALLFQSTLYSCN